MTHGSLGLHSLILSILFVIVVGLLLFLQHKAVRKEIQRKKDM